MNWVVAGRAEDENGYKNMRVRRGELLAEISFKNGNVTLVEPKTPEPFKDFIEIERWIVGTPPEGEKTNIRKPIVGEDSNFEPVLDSIYSTFRKFVDENTSSQVDSLSSNIGGLPYNFGDQQKLLYDTLSLEVAYMTLLLALETKYENFRESTVARDFRIHCFLTRLRKSYVKGGEAILPAKELRPRAYEGATKAVARCEVIVFRVMNNLVKGVKHPIDPIYKYIEEQCPITRLVKVNADAGDRDEVYKRNFDANDRDDVYKKIFTEMADYARERI